MFIQSPVGGRYVVFPCWQSQIMLEIWETHMQIVVYTLVYISLRHLGLELLVRTASVCLPS